ncbi:flagellar assembly protein A [Hydrogenimonas urashimensis]|uniref:flagellar assembly protein A n=1 Tax=Hydrogenimonas urashimensis TaxID=2740515 RepID=UPI0019165C17|nr:flagellar assembly protein A [Hydrogenimonas urashimensis]
MGFFDKVFKSDKEKKEKKEGSKAAEFTPVVTTTDDVPKTLQETALKYGISSQTLDIRIINYKTYIKMDSKETEWIEVEGNDWEKFNKPEILLNPNFVVKQDYEIEIHKYRDEPWMRDLILHIASNKEKNRIVCTLKSGSIIKDTEDLGAKLKNLIHKKMVRARVLIGLWDLDIEKRLDELVAKAKVQGQHILTEDFKFDAAVCFASQPSVDDALIYHYKLKDENAEQGDRIDYSKRGFIQAVEKGEVIIEYVKAKPGTPGRNCAGEFIPVENPKESHKPEFRVSENIETEETESSILYRARRGGYVVFKENIYDIREEMELEEVSFKKTGSIDAGVETEVKLHVNETDSMKEAIGTGVEVEATEVKVEGNVGASASITAEEVVIGGQTHQTSRIVADHAKVNVLRGYLKTKEIAEVTRIEGGIVEAKEAKVSQMIGGEVKAMKVEVELLGSNAKIYAVSGIEIGKMVGENNRLIIDASEIEAYHNEILSLEEEIEELEKKLEKLREKLREREELKNKSESAVQTLKEKILQDKKRCIKPRPAFIAKIKQFQKLHEEIAKAKEEIVAVENRLEEIRSRLLAYQEMIIHATVVNRGEWKEYTTVQYRLLYPQITLEYTPTPGLSNQEIYLKKIDEEHYEIAVREAGEQ